MISTKINAAVGVVMLTVLGYAAYELMQARLTERVYRERLLTLADDYETLRGRYNDAVRQTAVTELLVADGQVSVRIRNARGVVEVVPTPFDPRHEIYVDYVVLDGRLWIRRVFDEHTPPSEGVVIDPKLAVVDWDARTAVHGKAAYRRLKDGTWMVTVTGDGALGLAMQQTPSVMDLAHAPALQQHEPIEQALQRELDQVSFVELLRQAVVGE